MGEIRVRNHLHSCEFYGSPVPLSACGCMVALLDAAEDRLTKKDREIERLTATIKREMGEDYLSLQALYIQKLGEVRGLEAQLSASQAREREAVERAEKAEGELTSLIGHLATALDVDIWDKPIPGNMVLEAARSQSSDLAAARKALEDAAIACSQGGTRVAQDILSAALNGDSHAE